MMDEGKGCMGSSGTVIPGDPDENQPNIFVFDG